MRQMDTSDAYACDLAHWKRGAIYSIDWGNFGHHKLADLAHCATYGTQHDMIHVAGSSQYVVYIPNNQNHSLCLVKSTVVV